MAAQFNFICECGFLTGAWDDGNPYILDPEKSHLPRSKQKKYVYHPSAEAMYAIWNDIPYICLSCCHEFKVDTFKRRTTCTKCKSEDMVDICKLGGRICPKCKIHTLRVCGGAIS
jgi:hypothetical protein|tara:strand:+ start:164 stop:508 length:345 start_codon:yes stop_codon:yes gene_type:complete